MSIGMSGLINVLLDRVSREFKNPDIIWENGELPHSDFMFLKQECNKYSEFDKLNKRKEMFDKNEVNMFKRCKYGQIYAILNKEHINDFPLELWGRILRMFYEGKPFKIYFLAHPSLRTFPKKPENINAEFSIKPENINGGYTYKCNPETIVIYRAEDATRVLIHEIQHALCLDKHHNLDLLEAETEAWAELLYIGILSCGKKSIFNEMLNKQSEWIVKQNEKVKTHMKNTMDFPWRYTVGKEDVWRRWNILQNFESGLKVNSLRLTFPPTNLLKQRFQVSNNSSIL